MSAMTTHLSHRNLGEPFIDGLDWAELMDTATDPPTDSPTDAPTDAPCAYPIHSTGTCGDAGPACPLLHLGDELSLDFDLVEFIDAAPGAAVLPPLPLQTPAGKPQHRQQPYRLDTTLRRQSNASSFSSDADSGMEADTDSGSESTASSSSPPSPPGDHGLDAWIATLPAGAGQNRAYTVASAGAKASAPKAGKASKASSGLREAASGPMHRTSESLVASITLRERALLEGKAVAVPTVKDLPLTKAEESRLRASLRKIRNKDSAIRSRKKKEVYVAGLEVRVEECTRINVALSSKVTSLEQTNRSLLDQLNDLRRQISLMPNAGGTVMMMVIVCCGLQLGPDGPDGLSAFSSAGPGSSSPTLAPALGFRSRTLKSVHPGLEPVGAWAWAGGEDGGVVVAIARWAAAFAVIAAVWFLARRGGRKLLKKA